MDPRLIPYIKQNRKAGFSFDQITKKLIEAGHTEEVVSETLSHVKSLESKRAKEKKQQIIIVSAVAAVLIIAATFLFWPQASEPEFSPTIQTGISELLSAQQEISFELYTQSHRLRVDSIGEDMVTITIASDPIQVDVSVGEEVRVDVTGDDIYDLLITLHTIIDEQADLHVIQIQEEVCVEEYDCERWSACEDGQQSRTCVDINNCGTNNNMPALTQECTCRENWICEEWSTCNENGEQTRSCTDTNMCGNSQNMPSTVRDCSCQEDWRCGDWSACVDDYQTRNCGDRNSCGSEEDKPETRQFCGCDEKWVCVDESDCVEGNKTQSCVDINRCGTEEDKPEEVVSCTCEPEWDCGSWSSCEGGEQTRACIDRNNCDVDEEEKIPTTRECVVLNECGESKNLSSNEFTCFMQAAQTCNPSSVYQNISLDASGLEINSTNLMTLYPQEDLCIYTQTTIAINTRATQELLDELEEEGYSQQEIEDEIAVINQAVQESIGTTISCESNTQELTEVFDSWTEETYSTQGISNCIGSNPTWD